MEGSDLETGGGGTPWSVGVWECVWSVGVGRSYGIHACTQNNTIIVEIFRLSNEDFTNYAAPGRISWMLPVCYCESC